MTFLRWILLFRATFGTYAVRRLNFPGDRACHVSSAAVEPTSVFGTTWSSLAFNSSQFRACTFFILSNFLREVLFLLIFLRQAGLLFVWPSQAMPFQTLPVLSKLS